MADGTRLRENPAGLERDDFHNSALGVCFRLCISASVGFQFSAAYPPKPAHVSTSNVFGNGRYVALITIVQPLLPKSCLANPSGNGF